MPKKEYERNIPTETITKCVEAHKKAFDKWPYGRVEDSWSDENGNLCISYMTGKWFHYKVDETGEVQWW